VQYFQRVSRFQYITREYWFELLMAAMAIAGMLELIVGRDSPGAPSTSLWFSVPAVAVLVFPLFFRRRFPFAAPASYWLLAAALTYVDGLLIPFIGSLGVVGLATAFLLGNIRDNVKGGVGLAIVAGSILIVVHNIPGAVTSSEMIFITLRFVAAWVAGYALRERSQQAEAAEMRATMAEREREAAARIAVAEERARIARELHDVVAHSVSVMMLQIGAVRHKLPAVLADDREALGRVELAGRTALAGRDAQRRR
jgi:signal transduction histidine kinase